MSRPVISIVRASRPVGKHIKSDGTKVSSANVPEWTGEVRHVGTAHAMAEALREVGSDPCAAIILGAPHGKEGGDRFTLATVKAVDEGTAPAGAIARTKDNFEPSSWILLDRDIGEQTPAEAAALDRDGWLAAVERLLPGVGDAPRVTVPSSSARVVRADTLTAVGGGNGHTFVLTAGVSNSPLKTIAQYNAMQAGQLWFEVTKGNARVPRTYIDLTVFSPERLVFDGSPMADEGLLVTPVVPVIENGEAPPLDLSRYPAVECATYNRAAKAVSWDVTLRESGTGQMDAYDLPEGLVVELADGSHLTLEQVAGMLWDMRGAGQDPKIRCQSPFRDSTSMNAFCRLDDSSEVIVIDNGSGITHRKPRLAPQPPVSAPASPAPSRFAMGTGGDGVGLATEWVIEGYMPASLTVTSGPGGIGKTSGTEVLISQVADIRRQASLKPVPWRYVVYFTEDPIQIQRILGEANKGVSVPWQDRICVVDTRRKSVADLTGDLSEISGLYTRRAGEAGTLIDWRPLVVIDTAASSFAMDSINDNSEVSKFMAACKNSGAIVWILTHSAKQDADKSADDRGAIGAQAWAADAQHTMSWGFVDGFPDQRKLVAHKRRVEVKGELVFKSELRRVILQSPATGEMTEEFIRVSSLVGGEAVKSEPKRDEAPGLDSQTWPEWMPKLVDVAAWGRADGKRPDGKPKPKRLSANGEIAKLCVQDALQATANHWAKFEWKPGVGMCDTALEEAFKPTLLEKLPRTKDQDTMREQIMGYLGKPDGLFTGNWRIKPEAEIWMRGCHYRALMHRLAGG